MKYIISRFRGEKMTHNDRIVRVPKWVNYNYFETDKDGFPVVVFRVGEHGTGKVGITETPAKTWEEALSNAGVDENEVVDGAPGSDGSLIDSTIPYWGIMLVED